MSKLNQIQNAIISLGPGAYQKLMDSYIMKKYKFSNIYPLGSHSGTDKTTKGTPDSFVRLDDGRFVLIAYGTVIDNAFKKAESDIMNCLNADKTGITIENIAQIICCYTADNFTPGQIQSLCSHFKNTKLIGLGEVSFDLYQKYPDIAHKHLGIELDTHQIFDLDDFVEYSGNNAYSTTLDMPLLCRETELEEICGLLANSPVTVILGPSGTGKTRLALEAAKKYSFENDYTFKIIRNNGEPIYEDLKVTFTDDKNYLAVVDDGDQLTRVNHLLEMSVDKTREYSIKILFTVRDYAKDKLQRTIQLYTKPSVYELLPLKDESIKTVLSTNLGIRNDALLNHILFLAKGNIRLAIMAGTCALSGNFDSLKNAFDIFNNYYSEIIAGFDYSELIVASLIAFFDSFILNENSLPFEIAMSCGIDNTKFREICFDLRSKEIISIYEDYAVKFENQNLRDYLLYYVFLNEKWLKLSDIICLAFPTKRDKVVYALNTLVKLFYSGDNFQYIENEVKVSWERIKSCSYEIIVSFAEAFYLLIPDETLLFIKQQIELLPEYHEDLLSFDFTETRNHHIIRSKLISILSGFKNTSRYEDAIRLALLLFERNTESPMDMYFLFSEEWGFNYKSYENDYSEELMLITQLVAYHEQMKSSVSALCLLFAASSNLKLEFSATEAGPSNAVSFISFGLAACDEVFEIRRLSLNALHELYLLPYYHDLALNELLNNIYAKKESDAKIVNQDLCSFADTFLPSIDVDHFDDCLLLEHVEKTCLDFAIPYPCSFPNCKDNPVYNIYLTVKRDHLRDLKNYSLNISARERDISVLIERTSDDVFNAFWMALKNLSNILSSQYEWNLCTGINIVFSSMSKKCGTRLLTCCESYIQADTPLCKSPDSIVGSLINLLGFDAALSFIEGHSFSAKEQWIAAVYDQIPTDLICRQVCDRIIRCLTNPSGIPYIVSLKTILRINAIVPGYIVDYLFALNTVGETKPFYVSAFLQQVEFQEEISTSDFVELFKHNEHVLWLAYVNALRGRSFYDYDGKLLMSIVQNDSLFLKLLIPVMQKERLFHEGNNCLDVLWEQENYYDLISTAMDSIRESDNTFYWMSLGEVLLTHHSKDLAIRNRQDNWIKQYILLNHHDEKCMQFLFDSICNCSKGQLFQAIIVFCESNKSFEVFKSLQITPTFASWSGSEVPLLDKQIQFFDDLKNTLSGYEYIEHRAYLSGKARCYQQRKEKVLVDEFLNGI